MSDFTKTFGGSAISPSDVAYAEYTFSENLTLFWPQFSNGQSNVAARFMNLIATTDSLNVSMPDATLVSVGYDVIIFNAGSSTFNVVDFNGGSIATIPPGQTYYIIAIDNSIQSGVWQTVQFGVGTGSANAAALAGSGLIAIAGLLNLNLAGQMVSNSFTVTASSLAVPYVWTGGSGVITLPTASSVGNGFFFAVANNGSGSVTVTTTGGNTIDTNSTSVFSQTQSGFVISDGSNWITVGKGIQNTFSVTLLNLNVAGSSDITETSTQAQNIIQVFTGTLTGNINVIMPATVQIYFISNQTSGAFSVTVKTASGTGIVVVQGTQSILYCDGTNIVNAFTASIGGTISLTEGSAPSPSLAFQSDASSGLFQPNVGQVSVTTGGFETTRFSSQSAAVNFLGIVASATGSAIEIGAVGTDTNIGISIIPKGTASTTLGLLDSTVIGSTVPEVITGTTINATQFIGPLTGNVTGNVSGSSGSTTGNAATATALQTGRNINGVLFDGTSDITVTAAAGTLTGTTLASNVVTSSLTTVGTLGSLAVTAAITASTVTATGLVKSNNLAVNTTIHVQSFASTSTYTPSTGMLFAIVEMVGGGGGGGNCNSGNQGGGGGGSGGYIKALLTAAQIGSSQTATIGTAGTGGNNGTATSLGSLLSCNGGSLGTFGSVNSSGGVGGTSTVTTGTSLIAMTGQSGNYGGSDVIALSGVGGSNPLGFGGAGLVLGSASSSNGIAGTGFGSGGSGSAIANSSSGTVTGGAGMPGYIVITEYCSQ